MPYHCIVVAREVWDTRDLLASVVNDGGSLNESALSQRFEPEDLNSLEQALQLKDTHGGKVTVLAVGQTHDVDVLRECLYRGVDEVVRLTPPDGARLDTAAQARMLAAAIGKIGEHDLVLLGVSVPEGENSLLGGQLAALLGHDQVTYVDSLTEIGDGNVLCKREIEMGSEFIRAPLPAVLVMGVYLLTDDPRTPRSAKAILKLKMKKVDIPEWSCEDLGLSAAELAAEVEQVGLEAVPQRAIDTKDVDPESNAAIQAMLQDIL